jgi:hypothetical protein
MKVTLQLTKDQVEEVYQILEYDIRLQEQLVRKSSGKVKTSAKANAAFVKRIKSVFATALYVHAVESSSSVK